MSQTNNSNNSEGKLYQTRRERELEEKQARRDAMPIKYGKYWNPDEYVLTNTQIVALESMGCERHKILSHCKNTLLRLNGENMSDIFKAIEGQLKYQRDRKIISINYQEESYPERLNRIGLEAPPIIHLKGNCQLLYSSDTVYLYSWREECSIEALDLRDPQREVLVANIDNSCDYLAAMRFASKGGRVIALTKYNVDYTLKDQMSQCDKILDAGGVVVSPVVHGQQPCTDHYIRNLQIALSESIVTAHNIIWKGRNVVAGITFTHEDSPFAVFNAFESLSNSELVDYQIYNPLLFSGQLDDIESEE